MKMISREEEEEEEEEEADDKVEDDDIFADGCWKRGKQPLIQIRAWVRATSRARSASPLRPDGRSASPLRPDGRSSGHLSKWSSRAAPSRRCTHWPRVRRR
jgi:hypothetical protein